MVGTSQAEHPSSNGESGDGQADLALVVPTPIAEEDKTRANNPRPDDNPEPAEGTQAWWLSHQETRLIEAEGQLREQALRLAAANERNELLEAENSNLTEENMVVKALLKERGDQLVTANGFLYAASQLTQLQSRR